MERTTRFKYLKHTSRRRGGRQKAQEDGKACAGRGRKKEKKKKEKEGNRTRRKYLIGGAVTVHLAVTSGIPLPVCGEVPRGSFTFLHRFSKMAHLVLGRRARALFRGNSRFSGALKVTLGHRLLMSSSTTSDRRICIDPRVTRDRSQRRPVVRRERASLVSFTSGRMRSVPRNRCLSSAVSSANPLSFGALRQLGHRSMPVHQPLLAVRQVKTPRKLGSHRLQFASGNSFTCIIAPLVNHHSMHTLDISNIARARAIVRNRFPVWCVDLDGDAGPKRSRTANRSLPRPSRRSALRGLEAAAARARSPSLSPQVDTPPNTPLENS